MFEHLLNVWTDYFSMVGSHLLHLTALSLARRAGDFNGDRAFIPLAPQGHAVRLQRAEGDLQLGPGEAAHPAVFSGDLRGVQHGWTAS